MCTKAHICSPEEPRDPSKGPSHPFNSLTCVWSIVVTLEYKPLKATPPLPPYTPNAVQGPQVSCPLAAGLRGSPTSLLTALSLGRGDVQLTGSWKASNGLQNDLGWPHPVGEGVQDLLGQDHPWQGPITALWASVSSSELREWQQTCPA